MDHRYVAGAVDPDDPASFDRTHTPAEEFDGIAFVREGTPTTPLDLPVGEENSESEGGGEG